MANRKCRECGGKMQRAGHEQVTTVGAYKVVDKTVVLPKCAECGSYEVPGPVFYRYELRAAQTVLRDIPQVNGATVKAIRKILGLQQGDLGHLLGVSVGTVSRWENDHEKVTRSTQLAIAHLASIEEHEPGSLEQMVDETLEQVAVLQVRTG